MLGATVWGAVVTNYQSLLGARIIAAVAMTLYESLIQCVVGDISLVLERATRIAIWNVLLLAGVNGGNVVAGYIIETGDYRWTFGACAILFAVLSVAMFFLVPETGHRREILSPVVTVDAEGNKGLHIWPKHQINLQGEDYQGRYVEISAIERRKSYRQTLHLIRRTAQQKFVLVDLLLVDCDNGLSDSDLGVFDIRSMNAP